MGSVCLWAVLRASAVLGASISAAASRRRAQRNCSATGPCALLASRPLLLSPCPALRSGLEPARWVLVWLPPLHGHSCGLPSAPSSPSASRGFCALGSAPRACPLLHGACVHVARIPGPALCVTGLCALGSAPWAGLCAAGLVCRWLAPRARPLHHACSLCALISSRRLPSLSPGLCVPLSAVLGGLCALPKVARLPSTGALAHSAPAVRLRHCPRLPGPILCAARAGCAGWVFFFFFCCTTLSSPSPPSVWSHSP